MANHVAVGTNRQAAASFFGSRTMYRTLYRTHLIQFWLTTWLCFKLLAVQFYVFLLEHQGKEPDDNWILMDRVVFSHDDFIASANGYLAHDVFIQDISDTLRKFTYFIPTNVSVWFPFQITMYIKPPPVLEQTQIEEDFCLKKLW